MQIPLHLRFSYASNFDTYVIGSNSLLMHKLQSIGDSRSLLWVWGEHGAGKTHLMEGCCHQAQERGQAYGYMKIEANSSLPCAGFLEAWEYYRLVFIDGIQHIVGSELEEEIFHFLELAHRREVSICVASVAPPTSLPWVLSDVKSRFSSYEVYRIMPLSDEEKAEALIERATSKGIPINQSIAYFLVQRCCRNLHELMDILEQLDKVSLSEKRSITIPFVKHVLGL